MSDNVVTKACDFCLRTVFEQRLLFQGAQALICAECVVTLAAEVMDASEDAPT